MKKIGLHLKNSKGSAILAFVGILAALIVLISVGLAGMMLHSARQTARVRASYQSSYALESLGTYVKGAADLGSACLATNASTGVPGPCATQPAASACLGSGPNFVTFWDGNPGTSHLFCFPPLASNQCGAGKLGFEVTDSFNQITTICLQTYTSTAGSVTVFADQNYVNPGEDRFEKVTGWILDKLTPQQAQATGSTRNHGPYAGMENHADIPISKLPSALQPSGGLPSSTQPPFLTGSCTNAVGNPGKELCSQLCTAATPCLQLVFCASGACPSSPSSSGGPVPGQTIAKVRLF